MLFPVRKDFDSRTQNAELAFSNLLCDPGTNFFFVLERFVIVGVEIGFGTEEVVNLDGEDLSFHLSSLTAL
jgi:hypothetical protein